MEREQETSVQVAIRIRPQNAREQVDMCRVCSFVTPGEPQVVLGKDKAFTFDHVFDLGTEQQEIYGSCVEKLVEGCFHGFNATVLAYGQTGSGKTYTMGTGFDVTTLPEEQGMVPRAVHHLFTGINSRTEEAHKNGIPAPKFIVTAYFLELYNEEIIDLFDTTKENSKRLRIHETPEGSIYVDGAISQHVHSEEETMEVLKRGAVSRSVGSTNMNAQSSRSHAIFTLLVKQERPVLEKADERVSDFETLTAKFHFVDLAGSERLKRTGATGERAKEGISINCGLLALGNVISALGDQMKKGSHVPYRDSKLTRLLQDSLGGNSQTLMIACISPTDRDFMETLNTLKYANRARNIKNKVSVNQDKASAQLASLRKRIAELEGELAEFRAGRLVVSDEGSVVINDLATENSMLKTENDKLRIRMKSMQGLIDLQNEKLATLQAEQDFKALQHQDESTGQVVGVSSEGSSHVQDLLKQYLQQIEDLRAQLLMSESSKEFIRPGTSGSTQRMLLSTPSTTSLMSSSGTNLPLEMETDKVLKIAKKNIDRLNSKYSEKQIFPRPRRRRRKRDYSSSPERMSTDVEDWVLKCSSETNTCILGTEGEGSDTEVNEDDYEDEVTSDGEDLVSNSSNTEGSDAEMEEEELEEEELEDDNQSIATSIAELSTEINIKQQLVQQLEKAQKSLNSLRSQYEEKMMLLQNQIRATEVERDKVIKEMSNRQCEQTEAIMKEMKDKYEKQLVGMRNELKQLQIAKREHAKALQKNAQQDSELQKLNTDLSDMKKQKIKLMRQLKEETSVMKKREQKREKELALLRRDHKRKENIIRTLQADAKRKEILIRKRNEEVVALRRLQQSSRSNSSQETTGSTRKGKTSTSREEEPAAKKARMQKRQSSMFSSDTARRKWRTMEKRIKEVVSRRQTMNGFESEMDEWMKKREELSHKADQLKVQRQDLLEATEDVELLATIEEELDALVAQISWANDCIEKLQDEIVAYEDTRMDATDTIDTTALIHTCSTKEAKYLLENLVNVAIESSIASYQKEAEIKSLKLRLATSEQHAELIKIYTSPHTLQSPLVVNSRTVSKITSMFHPVPLPPPPRIQLDTTDANNISSSTNTYYTSDGSSSDHSPVIVKKSMRVSQSSDSDQTVTKLRRRTGLPNELSRHRRQLSDPRSITIAQQSPGEVIMEHSDTDDGSMKTWRNSADSITLSPRRYNLSNKKRSVPQLLETLEPPATTPDCPGSPLSGRSTRHGESSAGGRVLDPTSETRGHLDAERPFSSRSGKLFICTHTAKGHNGGILSLYASDSMLLSASQDCTVKVWDLATGEETAVLTRHHSYVRKVTYSPDSHLVLTACQSLIKLWDLRDLRSAQFVKTLFPPGQGSAHQTSSAETVVQDLVLSDQTTLLSASGNIINVWDLRQMNSIGRLVGHTGTVGTMTTVTGGLVATGSRDRLIKLYDVSDLPNSENGFTLSPQATLAPAHYDTVSSLAVHKDMMYSACGVSIKQWDITKRSLVQAIDGAHVQTKNNMITSLSSFLPVLLVSACKSGILKLWLADDCQPIGEVIAHKSPINCVTASDYSLFTGSSDKTIKIWRPNLSAVSNL